VFHSSIYGGSSSLRFQTFGLRRWSIFFLLLRSLNTLSFLTQCVFLRILIVFLMFNVFSRIEHNSQLRRQADNDSRDDIGRGPVREEIWDQVSSSSSAVGRILFAGFMLIWIISTVCIGFLFMDFAESWPDWGPGPSPSLFVWVPFAMAGVGVLVLLVAAVSWVRPSDKSTQDLPIMSGTYDDFTSSSTVVSGHRAPSVSYEMPPFCSQCGSPLDSEQVHWVGRLRFTCPSCGKVNQTEEKRI